MPALSKIFLRVAVALCLLFTTRNAAAETHYQSHISVGGHAGVALSQITFVPEVPQSWIMGPTFGVQIRYAEEKLVGVMAEINFVNRGWKETFEDNPGLEYSRTITYITIPIMTHISFGSRRAKCIINLGPEFGFAIGSSISSNFNYLNPTGVLDPTRRFHQMSMEITNKFDYGITAGAGFEFYVKPRHSIYIEGRFYYGLGNIFPSTKADEFSASRALSIAATLGYNFRLR